MRPVALLSLLLASAYAQMTSPVPYCTQCDGSRPTFSNRVVSNTCPGTYRSLSSINFRNFRFLQFDQTGKPVDGFTLRNGHHELKEDLGYSENDLVFTHPLGKSQSGESILVLLSWFAAGGSSSQGRNAKVFTLSNNRLRIVQEIDWDTHFQADGSTETFDPKTNALVIHSAHYIPGDAHCCVSAMDVVTFHWDGTHFVQTGIATELSAYGRSEGKTLPH